MAPCSCCAWSPRVRVACASAMPPLTWSRLGAHQDASCSTPRSSLSPAPLRGEPQWPNGARGREIVALSSWWPPGLHLAAATNVSPHSPGNGLRSSHPRAWRAHGRVQFPNPRNSSSPIPTARRCHVSGLLEPVARVIKEDLPWVALFRRPDEPGARTDRRRVPLPRRHSALPGPCAGEIRSPPGRPGAFRRDPRAEPPPGSRCTPPLPSPPARADLVPSRALPPRRPSTGTRGASPRRASPTPTPWPPRPPRPPPGESGPGRFAWSASASRAWPW